MPSRSLNFPDLKIKEIIDNKRLMDIFQCGNSGGMRRSHVTNTLILISDHTQGTYDDRWNNNVLYYTGMGLFGDQKINKLQNKTLAESISNRISLFLFEVWIPKHYTYMGPVKLSSKPFKEQQLDRNGELRNVWIFPLKLEDTNSQVIEKEKIKENTSRLEKRIAKLSDDELSKFIKNPIEHPPSKRITTSLSFMRNPYIVEYAKRRAKGKCQLCENDAPFNDKNKNPYLVVHHVEWLGNDGMDSIYNVVALCPNCHDKMHVLNLPKDVKKLKELAKKDLKNC